MNSSILVLALFTIGAPPVETSATPTTRLYVRTIPPGAEVRLDGKPAGKSDDLFVVPAGVERMTIDVELDGHYPEQQQDVQIRGGRITRVELKMRRRTLAESEKPAVTAKPDSHAGFTPTPQNHQSVVIGVAVRLDFRIAATRGDGKSGLSDAEVAEYKKEEPEKSRESGRPYAWFVEAPWRESTNLIERDYMGHRYVLLSRIPDETMLSVGSWGLKQVAPGMDSHGQPCISVELNDAGRRQMESLSRANVGRPLAIVVNDVVASAPLLRSKITNSAQITGKFTETEVKQLVDQLRPSPAALNVQDLPQETLQQLLQQLPYHVQEPWVWDELAHRQQAGSLSKKDVDNAVKILTAQLTAKWPEGWHQPLTWQNNFLAAATKAGMISPPVLFDLCDAVYGPKPIIGPLPRWREGKAGLQIYVAHGSVWDSQNQACLGLQLLWQVERVSLDGKLIEIRQLINASGSQRWGPFSGALKAGDHRVVVEVQCAYVDPGKMIGLNAADLPVDRWPKARKRWKQTVSAPLKVYTASEPIVSLVTDAGRSPGPDGGIKIDRLVAQADRDGGKKIILKIEFASGKSPSLSLSYDVAAAIEGSKRIELGTLWIVRNSNSATSSGDQVEANINRLDPSIRKADIILIPNPAHVEQIPEVSGIWGEKVILSGIPLERLDIKEKAVGSP